MTTITKSSTSSSSQTVVQSTAHTKETTLSQPFGKKRPNSQEPITPGNKYATGYPNSVIPSQTFGETPLPKPWGTKYPRNNPRKITQ